MQVELRPTARLRAARDPLAPADVGGALEAVLRAVTDAGLDASRSRLVCDWVQYRHNFRGPVDVRCLGPDPAGSPGSAGSVEIALDLRRTAGTGPDALRAAVADALAGGDPDRVPLEGWGPGSAGCVWRFNALYWAHLGLWEEATGHGYESALPGGSSDAANVAGVRELVAGLFAVWDDLAARRSLPEQLYVVELGVGNGTQAATFLDTFAAMDGNRGYYRRLHYLMCDYSPHVLELARAAVARHAEHVSSFVLDAVHPTTALGFLAFKVFCVYVSNVYDNLPTDEIASIGQREYVVQTRAHLPGDVVAGIAAEFGIAAGDVAPLVAKLLRLGPPLLAESSPQLPDTAAAVAFWRRCWAGLRLEERYVPLPGLDTYEIALGVSGEALRPLLAGKGDVRMPVGNGAVASFTETLPLLHPYGRMVCHDLFVTDVHQYRTGFRGPGKYDGSVVNWVNGPLLAHLGHRAGFDVRFAPFAHRAGSNVQTMTAQVRD